MDFDYKKYSLENLENWMYDSLSSSEATPQEIYDVIKGVVEEQYNHFTINANRCNELLVLLNGNSQSNKYETHLNKVFSCDKDDSSEECKKSWTSFWEENYYPEEYKGSTVSSVSKDDCMPPWGHSDMEALRYTEEELNEMCDKASSDQEKEKCREYNLREAEYYDKRAKLDGEYSKYYYDYDRNDPSRLNPFSGKIYESPDGGKTVYARNPGETDRVLIKEDKVKKWLLPVQQSVIDGVDDYYVNFPDDLLEAANLKEGDQVEWVDNNNGSYTLRKVTKSLGMDEC